MFDVLRFMAYVQYFAQVDLPLVQCPADDHAGQPGLSHPLDIVVRGHTTRGDHPQPGRARQLERRTYVHTSPDPVARYVGEDDDLDAARPQLASQRDGVNARVLSPAAHPHPAVPRVDPHTDALRAEPFDGL